METECALVPLTSYGTEVCCARAFSDYVDTVVMAGLVPAIPISMAPFVPNRDARDKPAHDGERPSQANRNML